MIFSSYSFIFIFFPVTAIGFAACRRFFGVRACKVWLVAASLVFYSQGNIYLLPLLAGTVLFNHACVYFMRRETKRPLLPKLMLLIAVIENLGLLFYFKYTNFFLENINRAFGTDFLMLNIILPIGISFYTFQILSYVVDVYRGKYERGGLLDFALFVTFFPQLVVGPIIRYNEMEVQLKSAEFGRLDAGRVMEGIVLFTIGCVKKILIADPLITHAQAFYAASSTGSFFSAWSGVVAFTFAYYFDFSGYIDMALGLGRFFNIKLPQNFNSPYKARNFADYWRRWNMTVSQFFNDYIFKSIFKFGNRLGKLILATMATFLVSGIWHGAGWNFIAWGLVNGVFVCLANIMTLKRKKLPFALAWFLTFFFVILTRVLFDSGSISQALQVYRLMFDIRPVWAGFLGHAAAYIKDNLTVVLLMLASAGICFFLPNSNEIVKDYTPRWQHAVLCGIGLAASLFFMGAVSNFLYFQF